METSDWFGCYKKGWQGEIVPEVFAHPAKFSRGLIRQIYAHLLESGLLQPGDTVILRKRALSFKAFGSTGRVGSYPIPQEDLSLADALAASGGPADLQANPTAIFLYREEPVALLSALGRNPVGNGPTAHVIYQINHANPHGFFFADKFTVRDRDVLYYASSGSAGFQKFMALLNTLLSPAYGAAGAAASVTILSAP
jgi:polysaccharide export outer membrane protein